MTTTLFLQSEELYPYQFYETMLRKQPVYWDHSHNLWAVYSYKNCKTILTSPHVKIPEVDQQGLNEHALSIIGKLARLSNGMQHEIAKHVALFFFENMKKTDCAGIIKELIATENIRDGFDWVNTVCKRLPVIILLKAFDFNSRYSDLIADKLPQLVKIMLPSKKPDQIEDINVVSKDVYTLTEGHLLSSGLYDSIVSRMNEKYNMGRYEMLSLCVSNLIGLLIQSYDAGRGLLSNSLLQLLYNNVHNDYGTKNFFQKAIIETLRFDPPVHNTKRIAINDIGLNNAWIKKGETILVVLAAANRDPEKFNNPNVYDTERPNNADHLTFGAGTHLCPAKQFAVSLATETLTYLFHRYPNIRLIEKGIMFEPVSNVRLPHQIFISLS